MAKLAQGVVGTLHLIEYLAISVRRAWFCLPPEQPHRRVLPPCMRESL